MRIGYRFMCFVLVPILIGSIIYLLFGSKNILLFKWIEHLELTEISESFRNTSSSIPVPDWVKYNLPDFLWVFSFTSSLILIWNRTITFNNLIYILIPLSLAVLSEIGQHILIVPGTFDFMDLIFYFLGGLLSCLFLQKNQISLHEKLQKALI